MKQELLFYQFSDDFQKIYRYLLLILIGVDDDMGNMWQKIHISLPHAPMKVDFSLIKVIYFIGSLTSLSLESGLNIHIHEDIDIRKVAFEIKFPRLPEEFFKLFCFLSVDLISKSG